MLLPVVLSIFICINGIPLCITIYEFILLGFCVISSFRFTMYGAISLWFWGTYVHVSISYLAENGVPVWLGLHTFSFSGYCQITISWLDQYTSLPAVWGLSVVPRPYRHSLSVLSVLFILAILLRVYGFVVLTITFHE